jgi:hypothetical protein
MRLAVSWLPIDLNYLSSLFSGYGGARLNPPEKLFDETLKAKIALGAIALESQRLQKF